MNKLKAIVLSALVSGTLLSSTVAMAADVEDTIQARQSFMQLYAFNLGRVGDMAKGKSEYDAGFAANAAQNLLALVKMKNHAMWPQGSSQDDPGLAEKTRAMPEIWTNYPELSQKLTGLTEALEGFVEVAGTDLDGLRGGMKAVGQGCKGCHENFRAEEK
jgi:cytochrome c556